MSTTDHIPEPANVPAQDASLDIDQNLLLVCVHEVGHAVVDVIVNGETAGCVIFRGADGQWLGKTYALGNKRPTERSGWIRAATALYGGFAAVEQAVREGRLPACPDGVEIERYSGYAGFSTWMPINDADLKQVIDKGSFVSDKVLVEWCTWCGNGSPENRDATVKTEALEHAKSIVADRISLIMELATELALEPENTKELSADRIAVAMIEHGCL
ncbi:hypothetical protein [Azospirillum argentinense]